MECAAKLELMQSWMKLNSKLAHAPISRHRLPSVRQQARTVQVSVSTVVEAYERLMAEGIILLNPDQAFMCLAPSRIGFSPNRAYS